MSNQISPIEDENEIYTGLVDDTYALHGQESSILFHYESLDKDPAELMIIVSIELASLAKVKEVSLLLEPITLNLPSSIKNIESSGEIPVHLESYFGVSCLLWELDMEELGMYEIAVPVNYFTQPQNYPNMPIAARKVEKLRETLSTASRADMSNASKLKAWNEPDHPLAELYSGLIDLPKTNSYFFNVREIKDL